MENDTPNSLYQSCDDISAPMILSLQQDILASRNTIHQELHKIALKCRYINNLLPVSKLSVEILSEIFNYFATAPFTYTGFDTPDPNPYRWILVTHVCHHWRDAALCTHSLWHIIHLGRPDCVEEFLLRSNQAKLKIYPWSLASSTSDWRRRDLRPLPEHDTLSSLQMVLFQAHRIEHFTLQLPDHILLEVFGTRNLSAFPALKSIELRNHHLQPLPDILTHHDLPALTNIVIQGYQILPYPSFIRAKTLTTLQIYPVTFPLKSSLNTCTLCGLIAVLSNTVKLKTLEFIDHYYMATDLVHDVVHHTSLPTIHLPFLEILKIHSDPICVNTLLTHCLFPSSAILDLRIKHRKMLMTIEGANDTLRSIVSKLVLNLQKCAPASGFGLHFVEKNGYINILEVAIAFYHFDWNSSSTSQFTHDLVSQPYMKFQFEYCYLSSEGLSDSLRSLLQDFDLRHIVYLQLSSSPSAQIWDAVMQEMGTLGANLIPRCSPCGLHALEISGSAVHILPYILKSWSTFHYNSHDRSLFHSIRILILTLFRRPARRRVQYHCHIGHLLDAIEAQADLAYGGCGRFSELVLQCCGHHRDIILELVDAVSGVVGQRSRFTKDPPTIPFEVQYHPPTHFSVPPLSPEERLPDADLDSSLSPSPFIPLPPIEPPPQTTWVNYVGQGRIAFDFRGSSGIRVEKNIDHIRGNLNPGWPW
ncbi:hypothetical protein QCA50_006532 [Cerrena zonata]|uniref:F-box domain-containing protein n=1 Tax=Cerrena zonata TaxID=2478898 RepID=A0AAW0G8X7_9APHY